MQSPPHRYQDRWPQSAPQSAPRAWPPSPSNPLSTAEHPTWEAPDELADRTAQAERRHGLTGAWLDLVAPPPALAGAPITERERVRRAELSSYVLLGVLLVGLALIPNGLANFPTLVSAAIIIASAIAAGLLNRTDHTTSAALVLIAAFTLALSGALLWAPQLDLMWMPALDFFAVPVLLAAILLPRHVPFIVGGVNIALTTALLLLKPRDPALSGMVASLGVYHFVVRPAMLILIVAIAGWLWSRSVEQAIARADRAEEVAAAEHQLARQKVMLERGIQGLLETHVRIANGDFSARAHVGQDNLLWQIAVSLNNLVSRLGKWAQMDQRMRRTEAEIDRLAGSLERARHGQRALWPALSGTQVDRLIMLLAAPTRPHQVVGASPERQHGQIGPIGAGPIGAGPIGAGPIGAGPIGAGPAQPASPQPGMMPGQWREASIQHVAPRPPAAQAPFGAPTAYGGQMPPRPAAGPGMWRSTTAGTTVGTTAGTTAGGAFEHGAMPARANAPDQTFPRLEAMPPTMPESRRERTHAYRQVPMPDWLAAQLPPLAAERDEHAAEHAAERPPVVESSPTGDVPTPGDAGAPAPERSEPVISLGPSVSQTADMAPAMPIGSAEVDATQDTAREESPDDVSHAESGMDWPGFLRQIARESD